MSGDRKYDGNLQMFVEGPREPDYARLAFLRWLGERALLEHEVYGPSSGPFAEPETVHDFGDLPLAS